MDLPKYFWAAGYRVIVRRSGTYGQYALFYSFGSRQSLVGRPALMTNQCRLVNEIMRREAQYIGRKNQQERLRAVRYAIFFAIMGALTYFVPTAQCCGLFDLLSICDP